MTSHLEGDLSEIGVYKGGSALAMAHHFPDLNLYCFDTFEGMPQTTEFDNCHKKGDFASTSFEKVKSLFKNYPNVRVYKGIFPRENTKDVLDKKFKFVHLDVDIYQSYKECIEFFYPRLVPNGIILFDDYHAGTCLGAKKAVDEFICESGLELRDGCECQAFVKNKG